MSKNTEATVKAKWKVKVREIYKNLNVKLKAEPEQQYQCQS